MTPCFSRGREDSNDQYDFVEFIIEVSVLGFELIVKAIGEKALRRGDILIVDNAAVHGAADTYNFLLEILSNAGVELMYLPAYSPELNPIELVFASVKQYLRSSRQSDIPLFFEIMALFYDVTVEQLLPLYNKCLNFL